MSIGSPTTITWLGHGSFRFTLADGQVVLVDPWLEGNPSCPESEKSQPRIDAILVTHGHFDHLSEVPALAKASDATVVCNFEIAAWLGRQGIAEDKLVGMGLGGTVDVVDGMRATLVRADHTSGISEADGSMSYGGTAGGFILNIDSTPTVYFAGDTALFSDMKMFAEIYEPEVAILPLGDRFTMGPEDAARAASWTGVSQVVPCHYGTFPLLTGTADAFRSALDMGVAALVVEPGQDVP